MADDETGGAETGLPAHEQVYRRLRAMVLFGDLAPGQAVTIQGLVADLGAGMTPVREAIRRLTAEGALEFRGNRRVLVPVLQAAQLDEVEFARLAVEGELARRGAERLQPGDVERLAAIDAALNAAIRGGDIGGYLRHNYRFHATLYERSGAAILLGIANVLWLRSGPSLRVVCGRIGTANLPDRHEQALAALRAGDSAAVAEAITADIREGIGQVRLSLSG